MEGLLPASEARILAALLRVHARDGRATVRSIAAEADRSAAVAHKHLVRLADRGLVAGIHDGNHGGTIRPMVVPIPV